MKRIRNTIRNLSTSTFTDRDNTLFGHMALAISKGVTSRAQFSGYSFRDEMESLSCEYILKYGWKFSQYKTSKNTGQLVSAFGWCTTIAMSACIQTINKWKKGNDKAKADFLEHQKLIHRDILESPGRYNKARSLA